MNINFLSVLYVEKEHRSSMDFLQYALQNI